MSSSSLSSGARERRARSSTRACCVTASSSRVHRRMPRVTRRARSNHRKCSTVPLMAESGWQVSGSAPSNWERLMVPAVAAAAAEDLVTRAGLRPGDRVLDVACGTGIVARRAVNRVRWGGRVTGVDINPQMLAVAREVTTHFYPPIEWIEGDVATLPLEDASFDVAVCQFAVQFFPDRRVAFSEIRRVLGPGGRLAFSVIRGAALHRPWIVLAEALDAHVSKQAGDTVRSIFAVESIDDVRTELQLAGFSGVRIENRFA